MDVFAGESPKALSAPKAGETVEDDLLRNLSDLNRLGPSATAPRQTSSPAPVAATSPLPSPAYAASPSPGVSQHGGMVPQPQLNQPSGAMAPSGMMPPSGTFSGMNPAMAPQTLPTPASQSTAQSAASNSMMPPGMPPSPGMAGVASSSGQYPGGAPPINTQQTMSAHQQSMSELQRQALEDEAALMQAISSTSNPVYVHPGSDNNLAQNALLSEQQIRAAQSISGGYESSEAYNQPGQYGRTQQPVVPPQQPYQSANQSGALSPTQSQSVPAQPAQPPQQQLSRSAGVPGAVSPSGASGTAEKKNLINPTKTLLESDLFFVDDELTAPQPDFQMPSDISSSSPIVSGGYAPSAMTNRDPAYGALPASAPMEPVPSQLNNNIDRQSASGTAFSQTPSFGPGSATTASKNAGSALLESMKKRNLESQSSEHNPVLSGLPQPASAAASSASSIDALPPSAPAPAPTPSANALSQYGQMNNVGTTSSTDISRIDAGMPNSGLQMGYGEKTSTPEIIPPVTTSSATFPARSYSPPADDIPEPQVGIATSSRIARSVGAPEGSGRGRPEQTEVGASAARSRMRSGVSDHSPNFFEKNKMAVIIVGVVLIVLLVVGGIIAALFAMHILKT
jgi:hypothetical protein